MHVEISTPLPAPRSVVVAGAVEVVTAVAQRTQTTERIRIANAAGYQRTPRLGVMVGHVSQLAAQDAQRIVS
jgi:hypothetical protein